MKQRAVIFDMDGTIVDSNHVWDQALHRLIAQRSGNKQASISDDVAASIHGLAITETCTLIKQVHGWDDPVEQLVREKTEFAKNLIAQSITFIDGFADFHRSISAAGLLSGVATNAETPILEATDAAVNLKSFFGSHLYSISCVGGRCKPLPDIYLHAAAQLGVDPADCIAIEDSAHGIAAARAAGMYCIGINTSRQPSQLRHAHRIIDTYAELDSETLWNR